MVRFLSETLVIRMHHYEVSKYGGTYEIRDSAALDAALNAPKLQFHFLHSPIYHLAATYGFHICQDHPFLEGSRGSELSWFPIRRLLIFPDAGPGTARVRG